MNESRAPYESDPMVLRQIPGSPVVEGLAVAADWTLVRDTSGDDQATVTVERTWEVREGIHVHMIEDVLSAQCAVLVTCPDPATGDTVRALLSDQLGPYQPEDLTGAAPDATDPAERMRLLMRLALGAPSGYREEFFARVAAFAEDEDPRVRDAVTLAAGYLPWTAMRGVLHRLVEDTHPTVRDDAAAALEMYDAAGVPRA